MAIASSHPGGDHGRDRKDYSGHDVYVVVHPVDQGPQGTREDEGHKACTMGFVLTDLKKAHHQGDHHRTPGQADKSPEYPCCQTNKKTHRFA
jgi:hypothetical protein